MAYVAKIAHVFKDHYKLRTLIRVLEGNGTVEEFLKEQGWNTSSICC